MFCITFHILRIVRCALSMMIFHGKKMAICCVAGSVARRVIRLWMPACVSFGRPVDAQSVRMIVASFLVKHLLQDWKAGARWFWDTLVDADLASNTLGWQWSSGCGADAAPYFRVFNPIIQGKKFDPDGAYVKRFVPELASLPAKLIHNALGGVRCADGRQGDTHGSGLSLSYDSTC